jgi:hypothetical protein
MSALAAQEVLAHRRSWAAMVGAFFVGFHVFQLALLVVRFEAFPNYLTVHNWPANLAQIVRSTPAVSDMIPIMLDEWLIEIGFMNYSFGRGIAEWSFVLMPAKLVIVLLVAMLVATNIVLLRVAWTRCGPLERLGTGTATTGGALIAGATVTSITWVVCCAAPTWVVGLAVMGMSVSTALALQPIGGAMSWLGLLALVGATLVLAWRLSRSGRQEAVPPLIPARIARVPT